ncbi:Pentatricopeptide repeat-containing protein At5g03800 [Linum grandiflorum]
MIQSSAVTTISPPLLTLKSFHFRSNQPISPPSPPNRSAGEVKLHCLSTASVQAPLQSHPKFLPTDSSNGWSPAPDDADYYAYVDNVHYLLRLSFKYSDIELAKAVHASILKRREDTYLGNCLIGVYIKVGLVLDAYQVFKNLSQPNVVSYSTLISGFAKSNREAEAVELFFRMRSSGVQPNEYSFVAILTACIRVLGLELGREVHGLAVKSGVLGCVFVANALMALYGKCGCLNSASQLFDEMPEKDITSWNTVISSLVAESLYEKALDIGRELGQQIDEVKVDDFTLLTLLTASTHSHAINEGKEIHGRAIRLGFLMGSLDLCNILIGFYTKCGSLRNVLTLFERMPIRDEVTWAQLITAYMESGLVAKAVETFENMPESERSSISYNAILAGFIRNAEGLNALNFFLMMIRNGIELSDFSLTGIITACGVMEDIEISKQVHGFVTKFDHGSNAYIEASLLDMYTRCGRMKDAEKLYQEWETPAAHTSMLRGYARNGQSNKTVALFVRSLSGSNLVMDELVPTTVLEACGTLGFHHLGTQLHSYALKLGYQADQGVANSLINMYSKCFNMDDAIRLFKAMPSPDVVSWNTLLTGYVLHRQGDEALLLWSKMQKSGVRPNYITFISIISAYSHTSSNLVHQCRTLLHSMKPIYNVEPNSEHYALFVGVLGSWGFLQEAEETILNMPFEPEAAVWRALLDSCRIHLNTEMGRRVAKRILEMKPKDPSTFVLVSNLYSASGRWHCAESTRQKMKENKVRKYPCKSWIIHNNKLHSFYVRDRYHPQCKDIYSGLEILIMECMKSGYKPDTSFVLHEVEEYQKKEFLFYHSAKLAATYGLLMTKPPEIVRIVKNVHVCGDCHNFLKHVSAVSRREILLRDASGFHFFSDGHCSCNDYCKRSSEKADIMATEKERMEKAEEAAWQAAYNLREVNRQREYEERAKTVESNTVPPALDDKDRMAAGGGGGVQKQDQPGVFGSMFRAVAETVGHARDAVAGKGHEAAETVAEKAGETKDYTAEKANQAAEKAGETKEAAKDKVRETKDYTAEKANQAAEKTGQMKEAAKDKARETKDYAAEKANQAAEKAGEVKDAAKDKARETKDYTAEKANQAAEKVGETKEAAKQKATEAKDYTAEKATEAKDYTAEKANQAAEKAGEMKEATKGKAEEYKNSAAEKARETKDYTADKAKEAADKTTETKDYTAEKTKQGTETAANKLGGVARMAMDFFSGKKDHEEKDDDVHITPAMMEEKRKEAEEETRRRVEELKLQDEAEKADYQHRKEEAERGKAARDNIYGAVGLGKIVESVKGKLTQPGDVVEETVAAREHGGAGRVRVGSRKEEGAMPVEKTWPGAVAATLKAADQMSGQTFNDVGRMGDEGVVHVEKEEEVIRRKGK